MPVFPTQNLNSQKICESYPKLLQIYDTGIVLDGTGSQVQVLNLTASYALNCNCPSGSGGGTTLYTGSTYPITASYALNSLFPGKSVTGSFCSSSIWTFNHNLGQKYVIVQTFDENDNQIIPEVVNLYDENTAIIAFGINACGTAVATLGGLTKSQVTKSFYLGTGSLYPITSSWALTASYALYAVTSSHIKVSGVIYPIKKIYNNYTIVRTTDYTLLCDANSGSFNVVLPNPVGNTNIYNIKKIDNTGHSIHITVANASHIDDDVTQSIHNKGTNMMVQSDSVSQYWIL